LFNRIIKSIVIFLTTLTGTILLVFLTSPIVFKLSIKPLNLMNISSLNGRSLMKNYLVLIKYLLNPFESKLVFPNFFQSVAGISHFADVKFLVTLNNLIFLFDIVASIFIFKDLSRNHHWLTLKNSLRVCSLIPVFLILLMFMVNFEEFFLKFHQVFFQNSNWIFDPLLDPIIDILPEKFFAIEFTIFFVGWMIILIGLNLFLNRKIKKELSLDNSVDISVIR
jgi:integral membrane protein (TIGR01906 family)